MRLLFVLFCVFSCSWVLAQDHKLLTKKEAKFVSGIFQEGASATEITESLQDGDRAFQLMHQDHVVGYLLSTRAMGRYEYFDYLLAFAPDLSVQGLIVTVYRSSHGAAICQKKWLSQFKAYAGGELTLGKDIDAVAGATISATALVEDIQRCYQLMISLKEEGIIQ